MPNPIKGKNHQAWGDMAQRKADANLSRMTVNNRKSTADGEAEQKNTKAKMM